MLILYRMVNYSTETLGAVFAALADDTRRDMLKRLARGDASVSQLAAPYGMSLAAVMKHLDVLDAAGLVVRRKTGRVRYCGLRAKPLRQASEWLGQYRIFWENRLDELEAFLATRKTGDLT